MKKLGYKNNVFLLLSAFFGIVSTLFHYKFGTSDQIEQLPIIHRFLNDNFLVNDFFVNGNSNYSPRYFYALLISSFGSFVKTPLLFFLLTLFSNCLLSIVTFKTSFLLFNNFKSAIVNVILVLMIPTFSLGSISEIYSSFLTPSSLVFPIILWSFYFLLKEKLTLAIILCGFVSIIHILIGLEYGILFLGIVLIIDFKNKNYKNIFLKLPIGLLLFCFLLFNLIPYFSQNDKISDDLFIEIVAFFRHPHHYILSSILTLKEVLKLILFAGSSIFLFIKWKKNNLSTYLSTSISTLFQLVVLCIFLGWFFVEITPNKQITTLQLFRLLDLLKWIGVLFIGNKIAKYIIYLIPSRKNSKKKKINFIIIFSGLILFISVIDFKNSLPYIHFKNYLQPSEIDSKKEEIADFVSKNTSKESLFLTPSDFGFIRTRGKRAIVVDYKAFPFNNKSIIEWYKRIEDCYSLDKLNFEKNYKAMDENKLSYLKEKYKFNYAILFIETQTKLPVVFANKKYKIITLED